VKAVDLYRVIVQAPVVGTDCITAEVSKTVENAYRDVNIAFANEVALMCESLGVNVFEVRELVNNLPNDPSNPSVNPVRNMHIPGAGVGGHCLPKDSWLLKHGVDTHGVFPVHASVIVGSRQVNDFMPIHMADLAMAELTSANVPVNSARVVVLGYAFLQNSDDTRNTPAVPLIEHLKKRGIKDILIHDPYVRKEELPEVVRDVFKALNKADCACIVTGHDEYRNLDLTRVHSIMRTPIFVDGRNVLKIDFSSGVRIRQLGRGVSLQS
jgi:UDP-N-acetyl-D-mannosaminuronic acid dehydrogenase